MTERLVTLGRTDEDLSLDLSLRTRRFTECVGQQKDLTQLEIAGTAARERGEAMDHLLTYGPPGLGKTTLAHVVANELQVGVKTTAGPLIEKAGALAALLANLEPRDVLFIDEIHRLHPAIEEVLYPAMEDYKLDIIIGQGPSAKSVKIPISHFTLIGATTRAGGRWRKTPSPFSRSTRWASTRWTGASSSPSWTSSPGVPWACRRWR